MTAPTPTTPPATLADKAKAVLPRSLKDALKPLARSVGLASPDPILELTRPSISPWQIEVAGVRHNFFFLCGCWRSGTHWVARVLNLHPDVRIVGEFHFNHLLDGLAKFTAEARGAGVGGWYQGSKPYLASIATESIQTLARRCVYQATRSKPSATWIGDHSPRRLVELLPGAPNVLVVRDGRDVLISQAFHSLRVRNPAFFRPAFRPFAERYVAEFKADPESFKGTTRGFLSEDRWVMQQARDWARYVREDLAAAKALTDSGTPVHIIRYEDLHREFEPRRRAMYEFLGLDPELAAPPSEETKTLPGFRHETVTSDNRKGVVGDWKNYFDDRITRIFKEEAGQALIDVGYEKDLNWACQGR